MAVKGSIHASVLTGSSSIGVAPGADVEVRDTAGALASLWTARDGVTPKANPFVADAEGFFEVYATPGRYSVKSTVGAEERIFLDVIVFNRDEPRSGQMVELIQRQADVTPVQDVELVTVPIQFDTDTIIAENSLLVVTDPQIITLASPGPPGFLRLSYSVEMEMKDGAGAAEAGDDVEVQVQILAATSRKGGQSSKIFEARTGYDNKFTMTGEVIRAVAEDDTTLLQLTVILLNRSSGTMKMELTDHTRFTIERWLDHVV